MADGLDRRPWRLTPLSPIHIGTGDNLDWTGSVLDKAGRQVVAFDTSRLDLNEKGRQRLASLGEKALDANLNPVRFIREAQQFFKDQVNATRRAQTASYAIMPHVLTRLDELTGVTQTRMDKNAIQALEIARAAVDPRSGRPMIPGSGVKGALRTSWVYQNKGEPEGKFQDDPFSQIAVEDFIAAHPIRSAIIHTRNVARDIGRKRDNENLALRLEAIIPSKATGFRGALRRLNRNKDAHGLAPDELLEMTQSFHLGHWNEQSEQMRQRADDWWIEAMNRIVVGLNRDAILIRLGKLSTPESKTVEDRKLKVSRTESKVQPHATTFWLAGDERHDRGLPFGWALLEPEDDYGRAQELLAAFETREPWRNLDLVPSPPSASLGTVIATSTVALTPGEETTKDLQAKFDAKQLSEDYLKSAIRRAVNFENAEEKKAVRTWIEAHYKQVVRQVFRHRDFDSLLAKLK